MPGSINDWSKVSGNNDTADPDINWQEGQFPDTVNDSARQMMGRVAEWRDDLTGTLTPTGTANALLITANSAFTSLANGRRLTFRAAANNTAAVSANVNGLGSKKIRAMGAAGDVDLVAADLKTNGVYEIVYSSTADTGTGAWILMGANKAIGGDRIDTFPAGTRMLFQQTTAPTGWTKITDHNDKALRVVSGTAGSGGTVAFTTAFSSQNVGATAITAAQMPSHTHGFSGTTSAVSNDHTHSFTGTGGTSTNGNHTHNISNGGSIVSFGAGGNLSVTSGSNSNGAGIAASGDHSHTVTVSGTTGGISANHTHTYSGTTTGAGSDQTHTHSLDIAVQYVDVIIASKDA